MKIKKLKKKVKWAISNLLKNMPLIGQAPVNRNSSPQPQPHPPSSLSLPTTSPLPTLTMAPPDRELKANLEALHSIYTSSSPPKTDTLPLLSRNKLLLLHLNALTPTASTPTPLVHMARTALELGALLSIRAKDTDSFTRYYRQLQPFYALPSARLSELGIGDGQKRKVTGLYLLLLLSMGDYLSFHMLLEALEVDRTEGEDEEDEEDEYIRYPVRLERALMEGSYDRVWGETKGERVPDKEFAIFSQVCGFAGSTRKY
jgi:hypothetical protein